MERIKKISELFVAKVKHVYRVRNARKEAKSCLKDIKGGYIQNDKCYKSIVIPFWKKFGIKPKKYWYRLFEMEGNKVDPRYIPDDIWFSEIIPKFCRIQFLTPYEDKCMYHIHFPELIRPKTVVKRINGIFYDEVLNILTEDEAINCCISVDDIIFKPSIGSGKGRKIQVYAEGLKEKNEVKRVIKELGDNFIAQRLVEQHELLESIHQKSLNTVRVLSMFYKGKVYILSSILRMGVGKSQIDNISAGGLQCGIKEDGSLMQYAYNVKREKYDKHPEGIVFEDVVLSGYKNVIETVKREHVKLPYFQIIGWDFAINKDNQPVFIEFNVCPWQNQLTCGPTFGDMTEEILDYVLSK